MYGQTLIQPDLEALSHAAATRLVGLARRRIAETGRFTLALAGGGTPQRLYELLATREYADQIDWSRVHVYFGDERTVALDHRDSNYRMAREALLAHVPLPARQVHPYDTSLEVRRAAAAYARLLQTTLPAVDGTPRFDLILLGLGGDGHTASLFPNTCVLRDTRLVAAVYVAALQTWRLSFTYPLINNAAHVWFLVAGAGKAPVWQALQGPEGERYPAAQIKPQGELLWFVDRAAAGGSG